MLELKGIRTVFLSMLPTFAAAVLVTMATTALASDSDISATFIGSGNSQDKEVCAEQEHEPRNTFSISRLTLKQSGSTVTGSGRIVDHDDDSVSTLTSFKGKISGGSIRDGKFVIRDGKFVGVDSDDGEPFMATFTGQLNGDTLTIDFDGEHSSGCQFDGDFTATRSSGISGIDPAVTTGTQAITPTIFFATIGTTPALTSTRLRTVLKSMLAENSATGAVPVAGGFMLQSDSGVSAGDGIDYPWGAWASYSRSDYEDDFVSTAFDANRNNVTAGLDVSPWHNIIAGVSLGYENNDIDTTFNGGNMDSDMFTVTPYIGGLLNDTFSVDFSVGYSDISIDQFRTLGTTRITSSVDAERWFVAGNLNAGRQIDNWYLSARAGLLYAKESQDGFTESNGTISSARTFQIGQLRAGGDVSYSWDSFEPFANLTYVYDYSRDDTIVAAGIPQPANDNDDFQVGAGLRWFGESGVSASFEWNSVLGREDFSDDTFSLLLRGDF